MCVGDYNRNKELMKYEVFTDIAVLGGKNKYRKKSY